MSVQRNTTINNFVWSNEIEVAACNSDWQGFGLVVIVLCMWATTRNRSQMANGSYVIVISLPGGVVILHIGVGVARHQCARPTPREGYYYYIT